MNKQLITSAFEKLGPEKVERGLRLGVRYSIRREERDLGTRGFGDAFEDCFLAMAYGQAGELELAKSISSHTRTFHELLGLEKQEMEAVYGSWDVEDDSPFRALAEEWLETNRVTVPKVGEASVVGEAALIACGAS